MHQQTYCHTLPKPFSKIFLFRIYAPTIHSTDIDFDETSDRFTHISAPIQPPQINPPTTTDTRPYTHTTDTHTHTAPQPHATDTAPQPHNDTNAQTPTRRSPGPPTQTLTPSHREAMPYPDVDAAPMQSQPRCTRSPRTSPQLDRPDRQDQIEPDKTGLDQRPYRGQVSDRPRTKPDGTGSGHDMTHAIQPARYQTGHNLTGRIQDQAIQNQTGQDQARPSRWQVSDRPSTRQQAIPPAGSGQAICIRRDQQAGLRKFFCQT